MLDDSCYLLNCNALKQLQQLLSLVQFPLSFDQYPFMSFLIVALLLLKACLIYSLLLFKGNPVFFYSHKFEQEDYLL